MPRKKKNGAGDDPVSLQLLSLYVVQKLGQGTIDQIQSEMFEKLQLEVHVNTLKIAADALRKRGFLSLNHGHDDEGNSLELFAIRNLKFQSPPEVAHYADLLPELLKTPEAEAIKSGLDEKEHKGEKKEKANRLGYRSYYTVKARFRTLDPLLGAMPASPYLTSLLRNSPLKTIDADTYFDRDPEDGAFAISADQVSGWIRSNIRLADKGDVSIYIGCSAAKFMPKADQVTQSVYPIITQGKGAGLHKYETVKAGVEFEIVFTVPAHGVMSPEEFRAFLLFAGLQPVRGLSPARGKRYGRMVLLDFDVVRDTRDIKSSIEMALANIPAGLRDELKTVIAGHLKAASGVRLAGKAPIEAVIADEATQPEAEA